MNGRLYLALGLLVVVMPVFLITELLETVRWRRWRKCGGNQ